MPNNPNESWIGEKPEQPDTPSDTEVREKVLEGLETLVNALVDYHKNGWSSDADDIMRAQEALRQIRDDSSKLANYEFMEEQASQHKARIAELERQLAAYREQETARAFGGA